MRRPSRINLSTHSLRGLLVAVTGCPGLGLFHKSEIPALPSLHLAHRLKAGSQPGNGNENENGKNVEIDVFKYEHSQSTGSFPRPVNENVKLPNIQLSRSRSRARPSRSVTTIMKKIFSSCMHRLCLYVGSSDIKWSS